MAAASLTMHSARPSPPSQADPDVLARLPPVLRAVVSALGIARAKDWLAEHGGVNVVIPIHRSTALALTSDELVRLRQHLAPHLDAGNRCWLPKADKLLIMVRDAHIRKERAHSSISVLARRYGLSSRHILNICRQADDDGQFSLF